MKSAIVTGASGLIGSRLVKHLINDNVDVYAIVRNGNSIDHAGITVVEASLNEYSKLKDRLPHNVDVFFHLAWDGTFGESFRDYHRQMDNAVYCGDALLVAKSLSCKRFVLAGTMVELEVKQFLNEDISCPRIAAIYGTAKCAAEMICRTLAFQNDMPMNTVILSSLYGEGDRTRMIQNVLLHHLNYGKSPKLVEGNFLTDWTYVGDAVKGMCAIANYGVPMKTYYLGHRKLKTFREWALAARDAVAPQVDLKFGEYPDNSPIDYSLINIEALYEDTGFEATADFDETIRRTAEWVKQLGWEEP